MQLLRSELARLVYRRGFRAPRLFFPTSEASAFGLIVEAGPTHSLMDVGELGAEVEELATAPVEILENGSLLASVRDYLAQHSEPL